MLHVLTSLKVAYVLTTPHPQEQENETLVQTRARAKWKNDEYVCRAHILNGSDALFDNVESAILLWNKLEARYMHEDATTKEFHVSQFNNYTKSHSSIVDKLSSGWKDFKRRLKHKKKDTSLDELAKYLRIKDDFHNKKSGKECGVLVIETGQSSESQSYKDKEKAEFQYCKDKQKKVACWICNGPYM
ncbi:hypothetical protein LIER_08278 [Lithospermum erythrorhizon]|uniref:Uncharacterized protein n=1 Tax=Lithospermum erythrorhizon TaxID=34254 RepID=A0AAV3PBK1_LITER